MFIATIVVSAVLAALLLLSARGKIVRDPLQMKTMAKVGFPEERVALLAAAEAAGAAGLIAGLYWWPLGVAAAAGIVLYFIGAVGSHLRVRDRQIAAPAALLLAGALALALRIASS